jgi:hypothetical protein
MLLVVVVDADWSKKGVMVQEKDQFAFTSRFR